MEGGRGEKCLRERETRFGCLLLGPWQGTKHGARHVPCQGMEPETFLFAGRGPTYWATLARATFRCENSMGHCWQQHSTHLVRDSWVSGGQMEPRGREGSCPWQDKAAEDANVHFRPHRTQCIQYTAQAPDHGAGNAPGNPADQTHWVIHLGGCCSIHDMVHSEMSPGTQGSLGNQIRDPEPNGIFPCCRNSGHTCTCLLRTVDEGGMHLDQFMEELVQ